MKLQSLKTNTMADYESIKTSIQNAVRSSFTSKKGDKYEKLEKVYNSLNLSDLDKRTTVDHILRDIMLQLAMEQPQKMNVLGLKSFVTFTIELSRRDICSPSVPVLLLSDLFDTFTLNHCEVLFTFVEDNVATWKGDLFFGACKNNLLRMCNDLLRRLSRSQNTVFRGRILLFLAKFFPFSERSGLNVVSEFNLDKGTEASEEAAQLDSFEDGEVDRAEGAEGTEGRTFRVDYNLYNKLLTLQDFCHSPNQCYSNLRWRVFVNSATDVLTAFRNFKLDDDTWANKPATEHVSEATCPMFFAKYLTNPKLLELQLSDPNFRRSMLIQLLILMQYLTSPVKFKLDSYELKAEQADWVKQQVGLIYELLAETPANSQHFADSVRHLMAREELWNNWKNEGCPEFKKPASMDDLEEPRQRFKMKRKHIGEMLREASAHGKYYMGHAELTRLWNLNPSNLEACKANERNFLPEMEEYFEEAMVQMDPEAGIEPEYKKVNDPNFGWRALRLLAQRSPCFFTHTNNPINKLPDYIETSLRRVIRDKPTSDAAKMPAEPEGEDGEDEGEELLKGGEGEEGEQAARAAGDCKIPPDQVEQVARHLGDQWRKLAFKLGYEAEDVKLMDKGKETDLLRAESMLKIWAEEDEDATPENLAYTLEGLGFVEAAAVLKKA